MEGLSLSALLLRLSGKKKFEPLRSNDYSSSVTIIISNQDLASLALPPPPQKKVMDDAQGLAIAFEEAKLSYSEGGIPVCSNDLCALRSETPVYIGDR